MIVNPLASTSSYVSTTGVQRRSASGSPDFAAVLDQAGDATESSAGSEAGSVSTPLRTRMASSFLDGAGADGVITMDELCAFRDRNTAKATQLLKETLKELGLPPSTRLTVERNEFAHISVAGDLSAQDRQRVEDALNDNAEFDQAYAAASSTSTLIDTAKYSMAFAKAYEKDPKAAVEEYQWLFGAKWRSVFTYEDGIGEFTTSLGR